MNSVRVTQAEGEQCDRCWNYTDDVAVHPYWPTYKVCKRCVKVLLSIGWSPYIMNSETDCTFVTEAEWHKIHGVPAYTLDAK